MSSISVIIPAYNAEKFIGEAIESALNQTRPAKEIVVVDDASTDRTVEIARSFGDRVTVLVNAVNSGPGHSRNAGVAASTGDYLAFLDADDKWLPEHLEDLAGLLDRWPEAGLAVGGIQRFGASTDQVRLFPECQGAPSGIFALIMRRDALWPSAAMVRRECFAAIKGFSEIVEFCKGRRVQVEDYDFFLRLSVGVSCISSPIATTMYRTHPFQASTLGDEQALLAFKYRRRLLDAMKETPANAQVYQIGFDQMRHAWDEHLRQAWQTLNLKKIRLFVRWGIWQPELTKTSRHYGFRALLPEKVLLMVQSIKRN